MRRMQRTGIILLVLAIAGLGFPTVASSNTTTVVGPLTTTVPPTTTTAPPTTTTAPPTTTTAPPTTTTTVPPPPGQNQVTLCHKGKQTVAVAPLAVAAHLAHGDTIGVCP